MNLCGCFLFDWLLIERPVKVMGLIHIDQYIRFYITNTVNGIALFISADDTLTNIIGLFTISTLPF